MVDSELRAYPSHAAGIPPLEATYKSFSARFAKTPEDLEQILRLRYEVFNLELKEGLEESHATGLDRDEYDQHCHHLMVYDDDSNAVIGTYRLQTGSMAAKAIGFYSSDEFDLSGIPTALVEESVEVGRACVARDFRNQQVLYLLWKGLAAYMTHNAKRYLFGCCSLTSQDPDEALSCWGFLIGRGMVHPTLSVMPKPEYECLPENEMPDVTTKYKLPKLFRTYMRYGAKACGPPAIDRRFKTIDFLVMLDVERLDPFSRRLFFG